MQSARGRVALSGHPVGPSTCGDEFALKWEWDIQVASVGLTPLAPTAVHPDLVLRREFDGPEHRASGLASAFDS
jgi:hypothetical protein